MKAANFISILLFLALSLTSFSPYHPPQSIRVGDQEWMAENLNVTTFRNGDAIREVTNDKEWAEAGKKQQPAYCTYANSGNLLGNVGKMYNWYALTDPRGLAPEGWRIPTDDDYKALIAFYQNDKKFTYSALVEGGSSGLNIPLGGWRGSKEGDFRDLDEYTALWSSTDKGKWASYFELHVQFETSGLREGGKGAGCYVRCIR